MALQERVCILTLYHAWHTAALIIYKRRIQNFQLRWALGSKCVKSPWYLGSGDGFSCSGTSISICLSWFLQEEKKKKSINADEYFTMRAQEEGAAYFQHPFWLACIELLANIHLQPHGSAGPGMLPNMISKLKWVWQSVCISCLCLGRVGSREKWVDDTSLCLVFMLYQNRGARRHHADLCDYLPGRCFCFFFSDKQLFFLFDTRRNGKRKITWSEEEKP